MKNIVLFSAIVATNVFAASGSEEKPDTRLSHAAKGVSFELVVKDSLPADVSTCFSQAFAHALARKLDKDLSFDYAAADLKDVCNDFEKEMLRVKKEAFSEVFKNNITGAASMRSQESGRIHKIALLVCLSPDDEGFRNSLKLKLEGQALSETCCTFFPPYTIERCDSSESDESSSSQEDEV